MFSSFDSRGEHISFKRSTGEIHTDGFTVSSREKKKRKSMGGNLISSSGKDTDTILNSSYDNQYDELFKE